MRTTITELLACEWPLVQAPMAGGGDTPELIAAVSESGGYGFVGAGYLSPQQILDATAAVRAASRRPFGVNLFAPQPAQPTGDIEAARARLVPYYAEFGLDVPPYEVAEDRFAAQLDAALAGGASAISFTFGIPPRAQLDKVRAARLPLIGTATTVAEGLALREAGVDAIVAQGSEAGGHRGTFLGDFAAAMIGTMALVPQLVDATRLPVLASGGIMDGRGIAAALALGAAGVQLGTAFLACHEAGIVEEYKNAILHGAGEDTAITRAFSGRPARGLGNRFMREFADAVVPPFPIQNALTRPLRNAAAKQGCIELINLWCGQAPRLARRLAAAELMMKLKEETAAAIAALPR